MAQIPEEMGSLSRPSPEFWYDKHTPSRKMTGWCPDIRHFKPLQCVSSVADYTVLSRESRALHLPLNTQLENCYSQSTEHCRPCNSGERHRFKCRTPEEAALMQTSNHVPTLTATGLHAMSGVRHSRGCSMPEPCIVQMQYTTRVWNSPPQMCL